MTTQGGIALGWTKQDITQNLRNYRFYLVVLLGIGWCIMAYATVEQFFNLHHSFANGAKGLFLFDNPWLGLATSLALAAPMAEFGINSIRLAPFSPAKCGIGVMVAIMIAVSGIMMMVLDLQIVLNPESMFYGKKKFPDLGWLNLVAVGVIQFMVCSKWMRSPSQHGLFREAFFH